MKRDWLWDSKKSLAEVRRIFRDTQHLEYIRLAALLLSRKNTPKEVFSEYLKPLDFCRNWPRIKREMRKNVWNDPRIIYWQAIYEKLVEKFAKKGVVIQERKPIPPKESSIALEVGKRVRKARITQCLTQGELAKKTGITQQMISLIESGRENISVGTLEKIARHLHIAPSQLIP